MINQSSVSIEAVVDLLGLKRSPKSRPGSATFDVRCPCCDDRAYHMNVNIAKGVCRCNRCDRGFDTLELYGTVKYNAPVSKHQKKDLFKELMSDLGRDDFQFSYRKRIEKKESKEILPVSDKALHIVFKALLQLPYLSLSDEHYANLIKRGLDNTNIRHNCYASATKPKTWVPSHPKYEEICQAYKEENLEEKKNANSITKQLSYYEILAGLLIADDLKDKKICVERVPGFFKLGDRWCFRYQVGMMIPTRNMYLKIVGMQIRRDTSGKKGLRYLTVSSKGFPGGVTDQISRVHFPLQSGDFKENDKEDVEVCLTEGPLKADIATYLFGKPVMFIALQGVSNTAELPKIAKALKKQGVKQVFNYLDMDKLTNIHVADAAKKISQIFKQEDISFITRFWDLETVKEKEQNLKKLCSSEDIEWLETDNCFSNITANVRSLVKKGVNPNIVILPNGARIGCSAWPDKTKGIDDYLLYKQKEKNKRKKNS